MYTINNMLILASKSPRRIELLKKIYKGEIKICPSNFDERSINEDDVYNLSLTLAYYKGLQVSKDNPSCYVISSDTTVIFNNKIYNKPKDDQDCLSMLNSLNNNIHEVVTGYTIFKDGKCLIKNKCITKLIISFKDDQAIKEYMQTKSPFDKAGGYGIQDDKYLSSKIIEGDYYTVMGLPIYQLEQDLIKLGLINK